MSARSRKRLATAQTYFALMLALRVTASCSSTSSRQGDGSDSQSDSSLDSVDSIESDDSDTPDAVTQDSGDTQWSDDSSRLEVVASDADVDSVPRRPDGTVLVDSVDSASDSDVLDAGRDAVSTMDSEVDSKVTCGEAVAEIDCSAEPRGFFGAEELLVQTSDFSLGFGDWTNCGSPAYTSVASFRRYDYLPSYLSREVEVLANFANSEPSVRCDGLVVRETTALKYELSVFIRVFDYSLHERGEDVYFWDAVQGDARVDVDICDGKVVNLNSMVVGSPAIRVRVDNIEWEPPNDELPTSVDVFGFATPVAQGDPYLCHCQSKSDPPPASCGSTDLDGFDECPGCATIWPDLFVDSE